MALVFLPRVSVEPLAHLVLIKKYFQLLTLMDPLLGKVQTIKQLYNFINRNHYYDYHATTLNLNYYIPLAHLQWLEVLQSCNWSAINSILMIKTAVRDTKELIQILQCQLDERELLVLPPPQKFEPLDHSNHGNSLKACLINFFRDPVAHVF